MTATSPTTGGAPAPVLTGFEALLADLATSSATLAKAMPPGDGGGATVTEGEEEDGANGGEGAAVERAGKTPKPEDCMSKSLTVTGENGEQIEVVDATEMVKSFETKLSAAATHSTALEGLLRKSFAQIIGLTNAAAAQADLIKSLTATVERLSNAPAGRRAVLSVIEKTATEHALAKALDGVSRPQINQALMKAFEANAISSVGVSQAELILNSGRPLPDQFATAISKYL